MNRLNTVRTMAKELKLSQMKLRKCDIECNIFGKPEDLCDLVLPIGESIVKLYLKLFSDMKESLNNKDPPFKKIVQIMTGKLMAVYKRASIPTISSAGVSKKIALYIDKYKILRSKYSKDQRQSDDFKMKCEVFKNESKKLFDICSCKCDLNDCKCAKSKKVPNEERAFLIDQRTTRKMSIGSLDVVVTKKINKRLNRANASNDKMSKDIQMTLSSSCASDASFSDSTDNCEDYPEPVSVKRKRKREESQLASKISRKQLFPPSRLKLPSLARACDRAGVSDRQAAIIASSALHDVLPDFSVNDAVVIDRNKIRRERTTERSNQLNEAYKGKILESVYFDGRKDKTIVQVQKDNQKYHRQSVIEEHISVITEPNSEYLGHYTPKSGKSHDLVDGLQDFFKNYNIDFSSLKAVGCDGTAVNTGTKGGAIRLLEKRLNKPLQWLICQLHANELPLRHLIEKIDGKTSGPMGFTGEVGKQLHNCELKKGTNFEPIKSEKISNAKEDLSTDQKYLLDIYNVVRDGNCSSDILNRNPGKMAHSRWLTTANRILRLYISTEKPSFNLLTLANYVMFVYAPMWFDIKRNPHFSNGAINVFKMISRTRVLNEEARSIVEPVIQRNAFFAHPENLLMSMVHDESGFIRELGWRRIRKARNARANENNLRTFSVPKLNFNASDYTAMIDWFQTEIFEPPLTRNITDDELDTLIKNKGQKTFSTFLCHTQAVERTVKLVSEASTKVCGLEKRDGYIRTQIASRKLLPVFNTKRQFKA